MQETAEHPLVHGKKAVPVRASQQASRVERRRLADAANRRPSSSGVTWNSSQPRPGNFRSALSRRRRSGSYASTVQPSMTSVSPQFSGSRRPRPMPTPPKARSSQPRARQSEFPKYQPFVPPICRDRSKDLRRGRVQQQWSACRPSDVTELRRLSPSPAPHAAAFSSISKASNAADDLTTVGFFNPSTSARPTRACAGVTSASQRPERCSVSATAPAAASGAARGVARTAA